MSHDLLACPFCGRAVDDDLDDTLYPSAVYWREHDGLRYYVSHKEHEAGDGRCWQMGCPESGGGCGARITGDSEAEVRAKWNRRAIPIPNIIPTGEDLTTIIERLEAFQENGICAVDCEDAAVWLKYLAAKLAEARAELAKL